MSSDPDDPRCPACDGPISATATYCMHCGAEFGDDAGGSAAEASGSAEPAADEGVPLDPVPTAEGGAGADAGADATAADGSSADADAGGRLLHPESLADDTLTVVVGVVAGAVAGGLALVLFLLVSGSWVALPAGALVWLGVTAYLATRHTVGRAFRLGSYAVAVVLLAMPLVAFGSTLEGGGFGGRVLLFFAGAFFFGVLALGLFLAGYVLGEPAGAGNA